MEACTWPAHGHSSDPRIGDATKPDTTTSSPVAKEVVHMCGGCSWRDHLGVIVTYVVAAVGGTTSGFLSMWWLQLGGIYLGVLEVSHDITDVGGHLRLRAVTMGPNERTALFFRGCLATHRREGQLAGICHRVMACVPDVLIEPQHVYR